MSGYLLDTHAALWWWTEARQLGRAAHAAIAGDDRPIFVSAVSALEIALKWRRGQLAMIGDPRENYAPLMQANNFGELAISAAHGVRAGILEGSHRDPFDRIIAAQALMGNLIVITRDPEIAAFGCKVLW